MLLYIPTPPSVNRMFCNNYRGGKGRFKSGEYRAWLKQAASGIMDQGAHRLDYDSFALTIRIARPSSRSDLDNYIKAIPDLLQSCGVIENDKLIMRLDVEWLSKDGSTSVRIDKYTPVSE